MRTVRFWAFDGCLASAVTSPIEILATANAIWRSQQAGVARPLFAWRILTPDGKPVETPSGFTLRADGRIDGAARADAVVLPGISCERGVDQVLERVGSLRSLHAPLRKAHRGGALVAANCSATFVLAEAGLLEGRRATTTWWLARTFRERFPDVVLEPNEIVTEQDGLVCSGAATAYMDMALHLVERLAGAAVASACARFLLIDANRASQTSYMASTLQDHERHGDPLIERGQRWIRKHVGRPFELDELAHALAVSERTLIRRFNRALGTSPLRFAQRQRIEVAKGLLETSSIAVDAVAQRVGYADVGSFRRIFKREVGLLPAEYRARFARTRVRAEQGV